MRFKQKITQRRFEEKLVEMFGHINLSRVPYDEETKEYDRDYVQKGFLYYKGTIHVGSWCNGLGILI